MTNAENIPGGITGSSKRLETISTPGVLARWTLVQWDNDISWAIQDAGSPMYTDPEQSPRHKASGVEDTVHKEAKGRGRRGGEWEEVRVHVSACVRGQQLWNRWHGPSLEQTGWLGPAELNLLYLLYSEPRAYPLFTIDPIHYNFKCIHFTSISHCLPFSFFN